MCETGLCEELLVISSVVESDNVCNPQLAEDRDNICGCANTESLDFVGVVWRGKCKKFVGDKPVHVTVFHAFTGCPRVCIE